MTWPGVGMDWSAADAELDRVEALWDGLADDDECDGTDRDYQRHRRLGEDPCDRSRAAATEKVRRSRERRRTLGAHSGAESDNDQPYEPRHGSNSNAGK